jgi:hypothetical protein
VESGFSGGSYFVTFSTKTNGLMRYKYDFKSGLAIKYGSDPKNLSGEQVKLQEGRDRVSLDVASVYAQEAFDAVEATIESGIATGLL